MIMDFTIRQAGIENEPEDEWDTFSFEINDGLADGAGIIFMRSSDYDLEGASPETEPYYIGIGDGRGSYGGITRIRLDRTMLQLEFNEKALEELQDFDQIWRLPIDMSDESFTELKNGLNRIFRPGNGPVLEGF
jgi:hypothetical protein